MTLGELLLEARKEGLTDLEALISFVVFEKRVQKLTDDKKSLERYLLPKHKERMNRLLTEYKRNKNMKYKPVFYLIIPKHSKYRYYAVAHNDKEVTDLFNLNGITPERIDLETELYEEKHVDGKIVVRKLKINDYKTPSIIGRVKIV